MAFDEEEHLGQREKTDDGDKEVDPVIQVQVAERIAQRRAVVRVDADDRDGKADQRRHGGFRLILACQPAQRAEGQEVEREILRRAKQIGDPRQKRRHQRKADGRKEGSDEGGDTRQHQRVARATAFGHRVTVKRGHHRRFVAGNVEEDGGDPPPIHRAVVDRGQQRQRLRRVKADGKGQRDQDRDAVRRAKAGQGADDGAEEAADDRKEKGVRRDGDGKAERQIGESVHVGLRVRRASATVRGRGPAHT